MQRRLTRLGTVLAIALMVACAHLPAKQKAVSGLQAAHAALASAQDFERQTYASGSLPALTAQRHADISRFFIKAFDDELKAGVALKAWRAGDPAPASLVDYQTDITQALAVARAVAPSGGTIIDKVQVVLDEVVKVILALQGGN